MPYIPSLGLNNWTENVSDGKWTVGQSKINEDLVSMFLAFFAACNFTYAVTSKKAVIVNSRYWNWKVTVAHNFTILINDNEMKFGLGSKES